MVTSLHDGMNLVAKEFVASREDNDGVLMLSSFTGAARELTSALLVNPFSVDEMAEALRQALTMAPEERSRTDAGAAEDGPGEQHLRVGRQCDGSPFEVKSLSSGCGERPPMAMASGF